MEDASEQNEGGSERAPLRRAPQQERSRARVVTVLEAADRLLAEEGAGALTTNAVAAAAGISVGSLYQYFPNKETIAEALAVGYWSDLQDLVDAVAEAEERSPSDDPLGDTFDCLAAGFRGRPGFLALWFSELRSERIRDVTRPGRQHVAAAVVRMLVVHWPDADPALRVRVAQLAVLAGDGLLREAFRLDREGDPAILSEGKRMLRAYVAERLGAARQ